MQYASHFHQGNLHITLDMRHCLEFTGIKGAEILKPSCGVERMEMEVIIQVINDALALSTSPRDFATRQTRTDAGNMGRSTIPHDSLLARPGTAMYNFDVHLRIADEDNA